MQGIKYIKLVVSIVISLWIFSSCSSTRKFSVAEIKPISTSKIIRKVSKEIPNYKSYEAKKVTITYEDEESKNTFSGQFKIKRDDRILLTLKKLSMPLGRGLVTTDSLFLINYFEKYFIEEQIETMQQIFGVDLDYTLFQALLTADVSSLLKDEAFDKELTSVIDENMYRIDSQLNSRIDRAISKGNNKKLDKYMTKMDDSEFLKYTVWVDPEFFVIRKLAFNDLKHNEELVINFDQYEVVGRNLFPQQISLKMFSPTKKMNLDMKLSRPSINKVSGFNFNIPDKYEKFKVAKN